VIFFTFFGKLNW